MERSVIDYWGGGGLNSPKHWAMKLSFCSENGELSKKVAGQLKISSISLKVNKRMSKYKSRSTINKTSRKLKGKRQNRSQYFAICSSFMIFEGMFVWPATSRFPSDFSGLTRNTV